MIRGKHMSQFNAHRSQPAGPGKILRLTALSGLACGLLAAAASVGAASPNGTTALPLMAQTAATAVDPAKQVPGALAVSNIDFKRGDGGAGKLIMRFSGDGAMPDLRKDGSDVIVDVGNASLPPALQKPLNVSDFATPVRQIDAQGNGKGTRLVLSTSGPYESLAYQTGRDYIVEIVPRAANDKRAVGAATGAATAT